MSNYAENRKARFNYETLKKYEAGIELLGTEVKSIRSGQMSLEGSFVIVRGSEKKKSLTIIPIKVYNKGKKIKLEIALVKGKKKRDKREAIKKREAERNLQREYKGK